MGIGILGNVMVLLVIFKSKDMRSSTNIFLMNLSVADLMVLLVCTPTALVEVHSKPDTWVLGKEMCKYNFYYHRLVRESRGLDAGKVQKWFSTY